MSDKEIMILAIDEAKKSSEPLPCGVVIAKDGVVIAKGFNKQHVLYNATAHAEILVIGEAGKILRNKNLFGCSIYCTCEPCTMCLSAIVFSKINKLVYGISLTEVSPSNKRIQISMDEFLSKCPNRPEVVNNYLVDECRRLYLKQINSL